MEIPGLKFRKIIDPKGDNAGFLSLIFPNKNSTHQALELIENHGIEGYFYWFNNQEHYLKSWEHLFEFKRLNWLPKTTYEKWKKESQRDFSDSNNIIEWSLSLLIKQNWSDQEVKILAQTIKIIVTKSLQNVKVQKPSSFS